MILDYIWLVGGNLDFWGGNLDFRGGNVAVSGGNYHLWLQNVVVKLPLEVVMLRT